MAGGHITPFIGKGNPNFIWKKHPDFGKKTNPSLKDYIATSIQGALFSTGAAAEMVDRVYVGNFAGELFNQQGHLGAAVAAGDPGLLLKPSMRIEGACASGGLAAAEAVMAVKAGNDCVLAVGAEMQSAASAREGGTFLARAADFERQASIDDFTFPCLFARRTKAYLERYPHASFQDLGAISAKAYGNGNLNPLAHMHAVKVSADQAASVSKTNPNFLSNEEFSSFLRVTDCSQVSDGGAACVFASEEGVRKMGKQLSECIEVVGYDYGTGDLWTDPPDLTEMTTIKAVVGRLMAANKLRIDDMGVAELHDCFSMAEMLTYEAIGLAEAGRACDVVRSGVTERTGKLPVNTGGGLISFGHPVGATGIKQIMEVYRQMKGKCSDYQLASKPELGLTVNMGGDDKTVASMILKNL
jgi:acetyl-CoA acyltransferase